jgi:metal-responsive CopG/Arc/MetJ family transcriptional regulator
MAQEKVAKVTISLPGELLAYADRLARKRSATRSKVIADLLKKDEQASIQRLMAEGYRKMSKENRREAEEALALTREVVLRDG